MTTRMTKAQNVAVMNEKEQNMRARATMMVMGVDATQAIALDELFGKKQDRVTMMTTRKTTRMTRVTESANASNHLIEGETKEEEEEVEVPTSVMRG